MGKMVARATRNQLLAWDPKYFFGKVNLLLTTIKLDTGFASWETSK